ncbi:MAG: 2Fe-2S iron-sulfur cluster binding domain-containing protein [Mesorhizobium sp.]|nr:MAG: 2Fe-2S iron-sulfur cluster binding domain-containing protein [Mesorhizobium sp.]
MIRLRVNGRDFNTPVAKGERLIHVLRDRLGLTGTRYGCGAEMCGACVVRVGARLAFSCSLDVNDLGDEEITTVEGLGSAATLHPVQQALLDHQAGQCGYCLSGIIVTAAHLLSANAAPTRDQTIAALDCHLCRCGAHLRIIAAVEAAAATLREQSK